MRKCQCHKPDNCCSYQEMLDSNNQLIYICKKDISACMWKDNNKVGEDSK